MSIDLTLAFPEKPADLDLVMKGRGFTIEKVVEPDQTFNVRMVTYKFFDASESVGGVWFMFHDGTYEDDAERWAVVAPGVKVVATGSVSTYLGRGGSDDRRQAETAKFLRDHYDAILYDPQKGQRVRD